MFQKIFFTSVVEEKKMRGKTYLDSHRLANQPAIRVANKGNGRKKSQKFLKTTAKRRKRREKILSN